MISKIVENQKEFMKKGNQTTSELNIDQSKLYVNLVIEETAEFLHAVKTEPLENQVKEAIDIIVVTLGWLFSNGIDPYKAWKLVHKNNMAKLEDGVVKDSSGKIMKSNSSKQHKEALLNSIKELLWKK